MDINKEQTLDNLFKTISQNNNGKSLIPKFVYIDNNRFLYNDLISNIDIGNININKFAKKIVFIGNSWYIKNWELNNNKFILSSEKIEHFITIFNKDNIGMLFNDNDIPDTLFFCESCENLITKEELYKLHSCKRCSIPQEYCKLSDKKKKKQIGYCKNYCPEEDDQQELCEECLLEEEEWDDPNTYAHCSDWEDEQENCYSCADDECPMNKG
jgi:hypothetical protein